jgi:hypothetical protein
VLPHPASQGCSSDGYVIPLGQQDTVGTCWVGHPSSEGESSNMVTLGQGGDSERVRHLPGDKDFKGIKKLSHQAM